MKDDKLKRKVLEALKGSTESIAVNQLRQADTEHRQMQLGANPKLNELLNVKGSSDIDLIEQLKLLRGQELSEKEIPLNPTTELAEPIIPNTEEMESMEIQAEKDLRKQQILKGLRLR